MVSAKILPAAPSIGANNKSSYIHHPGVLAWHAAKTSNPTFFRRTSAGGGGSVSCCHPSSGTSRRSRRRRSSVSCCRPSSGTKRRWRSCHLAPCQKFKFEFSRAGRPLWSKAGRQLLPSLRAGRWWSGTLTKIVIFTWRWPGLGDGQEKCLILVICTQNLLSFSFPFIKCFISLSGVFSLGSFSV